MTSNLGIMSPEERLRVLRYAALVRIAIESGNHLSLRRIRATIRLKRSSCDSSPARVDSLRLEWPTHRRFPLEHGSVEIVRPLLNVERGELIEVLRRCRVEPIVDPTNEDRAYRRNAIRHDIIPMLQNIYPGFDTAIIRSVTLTARDADALDSIADALALRNTFASSMTSCSSRDHSFGMHTQL